MQGFNYTENFNLAFLLKCNLLSVITVVSVEWNFWVYSTHLQADNRENQNTKRGGGDVVATSMLVPNCYHISTVISLSKHRLYKTSWWNITWQHFYWNHISVLLLCYLTCSVRTISDKCYISTSFLADREDGEVEANGQKNIHVRWYDNITAPSSGLAGGLQPIQAVLAVPSNRGTFPPINIRNKYNGTLGPL